MDSSSQKKKNVGRKPKSDPAVHRYSIKLNSINDAKFNTLFIQSGLTEKSKLIKAMIFGSKLKVVKVDKATLGYYIRLTNFYNQYQGVGVNYNQIVKALKTNFSEKRAIALLYKLEKATIELVTISKMVFQLTKEYEEKWLKK